MSGASDLFHRWYSILSAEIVSVVPLDTAQEEDLSAFLNRASLCDDSNSLVIDRDLDTCAVDIVRLNRNVILRKAIEAERYSDVPGRKAMFEAKVMPTELFWTHWGLGFQEHIIANLTVDLLGTIFWMITCTFEHAEVGNDVLAIVKDLMEDSASPEDWVPFFSKCPNLFGMGIIFSAESASKFSTLSYLSDFEQDLEQIVPPPIRTLWQTVQHELCIFAEMGGSTVPMAPWFDTVEPEIEANVERTRVLIQRDFDVRYGRQTDA